MDSSAHHLHSLAWRIGTVGFSYAEWQPAFYGAGLRSADFLGAYAAHFDMLELDTTFHAIPPIERVQKWADTVPAHFIFCPKTPKQITHDAPIAFGLPAMRQFLRSLAPMQKAGKLGPILIQFPPTFTAAERPNLAQFLAQLPESHRFAVELRHASWVTEGTVELLRQHRVAWVAADYWAVGAPTVPPAGPLVRTTDFLYLRFIGIHGQYAEISGERTDPTGRLAGWLEKLAAIAGRAEAGTKVYAVVNNDFCGFAPAAADRLRGLLGLPVPKRPTPPAAAQQSLF